MNRFATFADPDEAQTVAKPAQKAVQKEEPKKKVVIKAKPAAEGNEEGFEFQGRSAAPAQRGSRGGRGGRGRGDRPEGESRRGGRGDGERRGRGDGERRGRGDGERRGRGGRGRGDREPREDRGDAAAVEGETAGADGEGRPQTREKRFNKYAGKAREEAHPFDRKDGTGRGRRGDKKGGEGRGNWGNNKKPEDGAEGETPAAEEQVEKKPVEEEKKVEEEPIIYEEVGLSLDDYLAQKQASSKGLLAKATGRQHEKQTMKGVELGEDTKRISTIESQLRGDQVYAPKVEGGEFFAFSAKEEQVQEDDGDRRGGRGGRGRDDRRPMRGAAERKPREAGGRGRKGGKIVVDDNDFPTL